MILRKDEILSCKADWRIDNARVVDVLSGTIREGSVSIGGGRILGFTAFDVADPSHCIDAKGRYLLPGLIDSHVHIESSMLCPARFAEAVLPYGTTTVIADPHEIANVKGMEGVHYMLDASRDLPLDVRIALPSCVPALPVEDAGAVLTATDLAPLMTDPKVAGLGEMMNVPGYLGQDADVMAKIASALAAGKPVDGHSPGLSGKELDAYAALVSTDHECTTIPELQDRIARGMYVLLRQGSASHDLPRLLPGVTPENSRRCLFCTDDCQPVDILSRGHITHHLRLSVAAGLDPITAIRMATLNAAECYGLRDKGAIAPGRIADLILVDDLTHFNVTDVWAQGVLVAQHGRMLQSLPLLDPGSLQSSVNYAPLASEISPHNKADSIGAISAALQLAVPSGQARVISLLPHSLVTECAIMPVNITAAGMFDFARNPGMIKIAVVERHHATGKIGVGLLDPVYGLRNGAIATTIAHDSHNIVVAGDNDEDMLFALAEIKRIKGGIVMVSQGKVLAELELPVGGLMSHLPARDVADTLMTLHALARDHYHIWDKADAFMTLSFMALPVIPHLKITARGLFDIDNFQFVSVDAALSNSAR